VCAIYSTFLQRGFDQLVHDVCIQDLNVKFCLDRGGIAGGDGQTHHGLLDIAYMRAVPNIVVMAPKDEGEMRDMMYTMLEHTGPTAMRYPRGNGVGVDITREPELLEIGKGEILRDGGEIAIGGLRSDGSSITRAAETVGEREGSRRLSSTPRFVKPLDAPLLLALARTKRLIVTVEEATSPVVSDQPCWSCSKRTDFRTRCEWSAWVFRID
jgi:1-deoxy-D-xylulose-5-phosphate synthase